jgi:AcrR family transcriptional regulator
MLATPWGDADTLRDRRLPPGRSGDRDAARREQRVRLYAAIVASCDEKGYEATSVEDLLRISGVSRATFYEQFADKNECFRAAEQEIVTRAIAAVADHLGAEGDPVERARAALGAFVDVVVAQPAAARICFVESYAAGEEALGQIWAAFDWIVVLASDVAKQMPGREELPRELLQGIVGGIYRVVYKRLLERREAELPDLVEPLWEWAMSFPSPPRPLRRSGRLVVARPIPEAPPFASFSPEQRIIRGFARVVVEKGYPATTIADIAAAAAISQTTFYEHFDGKIEVLATALESSGAQMLAAVLPAVRRTADWRMAMRIAFEEVCGFLAAEPAFASMRCVDAYAGGPEAIAIREAAGTQVIAELAAIAFAESGTAAADLDSEASSGAIHAILAENVRAGDSADLPRLAPFLTYFALVPFLGAEEACEVANGRGRT